MSKLIEANETSETRGIDLAAILRRQLARPVHAAARGVPDRTTADVIIEALVEQAGGGNVGAIALIFELERRDAAANVVPYAMARSVEPPPWPHD